MDVDTIRRRSGSSWITVYQSYQAISVSATSVYAVAPLGSFEVGGYSTVTVTGGKGTLTYTWTLVDGMRLYQSGTSRAYFRYEPLRPGSGGAASATYRVTVTDGISSDSATIRVDLAIGQPI